MLTVVVLAITGTFLYSPILFLAVALPIYQRRVLHESTTKTTKIVFSLIFFFTLTRICWLWFRSVVSFGKEGWDDFIVNRISQVSFFTTFAIVLFNWVESLNYQSTYNAPKFLPTQRWKFLAVELLLCVFTSCTTAAFFITGGDPENRRTMDLNASYQVFNYGMAGLNLIAALCFLFYGFLFGSQGTQFKILKDLRIIQVRILTLGFAVCFIGKFAILLYHPITKKWIDDSLFVVFAYFIPEIVPCLIQIYIQFKQAQYLMKQSELRPWERNSLLIKE